MQNSSNIFSMIRNIWPKKIRLNLILSIAVVHLLLMSFFVFDMMQRQKNFLRKQNLENARHLANSVSAGSGLYMIANDAVGLQNLVDDYKSFPHLHYAMITSTDGLVLAHTDKKFVGLHSVDSLSQHSLAGRSSQVLIQNDQQLDIAAPIISNFNKQIIGWVRIGMSQDFIATSLSDISLRASLYILLAVLIGIIAATLIANRLSAGLYKLTNTANKISNGARDVRMPPMRSKELSELAKAFNIMIDKISASEKLLTNVIEIMPVGVWLINDKGEIVLNNTAGRKIWAMTAEANMNDFGVYKARFAETKKIVKPDEWAASRSLITGETIINEEIEIQAVDNKEKIILNSSIPLNADNGNISGAVAVSVDVTENKKISRQLALSESSLSSAFEHSAIGMAMVAADGKWTKVNKELCRIVGYSEKELLSLTFQELTHPEDLEIDFDFINRAMAGEIDSYRREKRYLHKDGHSVWVHVAVSLVRGQEGEPLFFISQIEDISDIRESESKFENLVEKSIVGVYILQNGKFAYVNPRLAQDFGYSQDELLNLSAALETVYKDDRHRAMQLWQKRAEGNPDIYTELRFERKDGHVIWCEINSTEIDFKGGKAVIGTLKDITVRKKAEATIKEQAEIFEAIVENTSEAIYLISPEYRVLRYNQVARQRIANVLDKNISIDADFRELLFPGAKDIFHSMFNDALHGIRGDREIMTSDVYGNNFWYRFKTNPVYDRHQNLIGVVLLSENIDERKRAEGEILRLNRLYQFISQVNASMLKLETSDDIFREACNIAVEYGEFTMAWIGLYNEFSGVLPVAWAGNENGYLKAISKSADYVQTDGVGVAEKAGMKKSIQILNDIANEDLNDQWKNEALTRNYRSCISLPVLVNSDLIAIYTIFASEPFFFNQAEVQLLQEVTDNIAYALDKVRIEELHEKSEEQLRESEEKFRKLVEETLVGVYILQDEKFTYANPALEKIFGYDPGKLNGKPFIHLIHEHDKQRAKTKHREKISGEEESHRYVLKALKRDGSLIFIETISSRILYLGKPAVIGTVIDITQQLEEEKRISKAVTDAQEMERQQISMELHDNVKQIMAASLLNVDMIPMLIDDKKTLNELSEKVKSYIKEAIEELRRISHRLAPSIDQTVPLQEKFKTVVNTMNVSKGINVSYHFDKVNKPIGSDVQLAMYRILQEQLSNILKYAKASDVQIDVHKISDGISMSIEDNGIGFDTKAKKSGIGLENIKRRVQAFNGKFNIKSSPGHGCQLNVELPV